MRNEIAKLISEYRNRKGLTQVALAELMGVSQQSVAKWESGLALPRVKVLRQIADALNIDVAVFEGARGSDWWDRRWGQAERADQMDIDDVILKKTKLLIPENSLQFPPSSEEIGSLEVAEQVKSIIRPLLGELHPDGKWNEVVKGNSLTWRRDYSNRLHVVKFIHAQDGLELAVILSKTIRTALWEMATLRAHSKDGRVHILMLTAPFEVPVEGLAWRIEAPDQVVPTSNFVALRKVTAEAALMDIFVFLARSPGQVASYLDSLEETDTDFDEERYRN